MPETNLYCVIWGDFAHYEPQTERGAVFLCTQFNPASRKTLGFLLPGKNFIESWGWRNYGGNKSAREQTHKAGST